jgi:hypothetical protein
MAVGVAEEAAISLSVIGFGEELGAAAAHYVMGGDAVFVWSESCSPSSTC